MKVNQIVNEHKKGVRAMKYNKKTKGAVPVYGPDANNAKLKPVKPTGTISEEAKITKTGPEGVEITADTGIKTTLPADKAAALQPDPQNPNEYDLNPAATAPTGGEMAGPKVGSSVEIKTAEDAGDVGTMPTSEFVKGIYSVAAEYGGEAPDPDAIKQQMVLAPNGEVDMQKTFEKIYATFQAQIPKIEQMIKDLEAILQSPEAQQAMNPELARIQELAGQDIAEGAVDTIAKKAKQFSTYMTEPDTPQRTVVRDRAKNIDKIRNQEEKKTEVKESAELTAMLTIAGLR